MNLLPAKVVFFLNYLYKNLNIFLFLRTINKYTSIQ